MRGIRSSSRLWSALLVVAIAPQTARGQVENENAAAQVVQQAHSHGMFDGIVLLTENGKAALAVAVGDADRARKIPIRMNTVFRLASLTKQVTALLIMQEVEAGRVRLNQKAGDFLSALPEASARVTVQQLLQHVSGLSNPSDGPEDRVPAFYTRTGGDAANMTATARGFCSATPKRMPGGSFEYNNCDYIVLGAVLEAVSGRTYAQLVSERVIAKLGLTSWGLFPADPKGAPPVARDYQENGTESAFQNPATYGSAGGLYGNALDLAKWNEALLSHQLLSASNTETMFRADPKLYGEALGSWSYDLAITTPPLHIVERQGDIGGTKLLSLLLPNRNASLVIIANTERADLFNTYSRQGLGYEILRAWYAASSTPKP